jgi:hypothetical protein
MDRFRKARAVPAKLRIKLGLLDRFLNDVEAYANAIVMVTRSAWRRNESQNQASTGTALIFSRRATEAGNSASMAIDVSRTSE